MTTLAALGRFALDLVLPPLCLACGTPVVDAGALCGDCFAGVAFISDPLCRRCGTPFALDMGSGQECVECLAAPPAFGRARAVFRYDPASSLLVVRFKHADRTDAAPAFARWMAAAGREVLTGADVLVPVPLHRRRLFLRRYNQAALLALGVGRCTGTPVAVDALVRRLPTASQGGLGRGARRRNVAGAFAVARPAAIADRRVVVVDDVLTTGATVGACADALLDAGAAAVDVLTLARVVRETP